jgi:hypothetical protein
MSDCFCVLSSLAFECSVLSDRCATTCQSPHKYPPLALQVVVATLVDGDYVRCCDAVASAVRCAVGAPVAVARARVVVVGRVGQVETGRGAAASTDERSAGEQRRQEASGMLGRVSLVARCVVGTSSHFSYVARSLYVSVCFDRADRAARIDRRRRRSRRLHGVARQNWFGVCILVFFFFFFFFSFRRRSLFNLCHRQHARYVGQGCRCSTDDTVAGESVDEELPGKLARVCVQVSFEQKSVKISSPKKIKHKQKTRRNCLRNRPRRVSTRANCTPKRYNCWRFYSVLPPSHSFLSESRIRSARCIVKEWR